jgi:hypothetical protein
MKKINACLSEESIQKRVRKRAQEHASIGHQRQEARERSQAKEERERCEKKRRGSKDFCLFFSWVVALDP